MANTIKNLKLAAETLINGLSMITAYLFAGKATITLHNTLTGRRISYRVTVARTKTEAGGYKAAYGAGPWDVETHTADGWVPLGYVLKGHSGARFIASKRRKGGWDVLASTTTESATFAWLINRVREGRELPKPVQVWRSNNCGRCGKELITEFGKIGFGETCCGHLGIDHKRIFRRLSWMSDMTESDKAAKVREMVHSGLTVEGRTILTLLPGLAGEYARQCLEAA